MVMRDALAGEILDRAHARIPGRVGDGDGNELVARPLGALRRDHLQPALGGEIVEARGEGGHAEVGVARHDGERRLGRGGEVLDREVEARLLEPALLERDEDRPRRGQPQQRDRRLGEVLARARRTPAAPQPSRPMQRDASNDPGTPTPPVFLCRELLGGTPATDGSMIIAAVRQDVYFLVMPQNTVTGGGTAGVSTLLRTAQTPNHSPSGTWVTICMACFCTASAAAFFSAGVPAAMKFVAQLLHARVARPAGARLLAGRGQVRRHQRVEDVELHPARAEGAPAAFETGPLFVSAAPPCSASPSAGPRP